MKIEITKAPVLVALQNLKIADYDAILVPCNKDLSVALLDGTINIPPLADTGSLPVVALLAKKKSFTGKVGQFFSVPVNASEGVLVTAVFFGIDADGENVDFSDNATYFRAGGLARSGAPTGCKQVAILSPQADGVNVFSPSCLLSLASGFADASYSFATYVTDEKKLKNINSISAIHICAPIEPSLVSEANSVINSVTVAKDLVNYPPNTLYPESYADFISSYFSGAEGVDVDIYDSDKLEQMGFRMLLAVGQASHLPPRVAVLKYKGDNQSKDYSVSLVGKGLTFDSGGLSIKPANYMMTMKTDMAGSATVIGVIKALSENRVKINAVGLVGLVENAVGGNAQRPSDIVRSLSGKTVEVLNTDAEGRLVLGDLLTFAQQEFKPKYIIDLATLTGAITVGLGEFYAGLFSNSSRLSNALMESGKATGEKMHCMPMGSEYSDMLKSPIADIKNISATGLAGSITAAEFLKFFIEDGTQWAHIDIAGTAYLEKPYPSSHKKFATGFGVKVLYDMLRNRLGDLF